MITRNEEKNIERCLRSLPSNIDEIIVLDGFSSDKTVNIAKNFKAKIFQRKFSGSYSDERNHCISLANNDWILTLDADEVLSYDLKTVLENLISKKEPNYVMYCSPRKTIRAGKFIFEYYSYPNFKPVLFDRRRCNYVGFVHETLIINGKKKFIPHHILHYKDRAKNPGPLQVRYNRLAKKTNYRINQNIFERIGNAWFIFKSMFFGLGFFKSLTGWKYTFGYIYYVYKKKK